MPISKDLKNQYTAVLDDLEGERTEVQREVGSLQKRLRELDNTITSLHRRIDPDYATVQKSRAVVELRSPAEPKYPADQKYAFIGVRWAILHLLSEVGPMATSDIAEALKGFGVRTKAANFSNNVSAVLSTTMRSKGQEEVEAIDGEWRLTEIGRNKITHIITSADFLKACPWAAPTPAASASGTGH